MIPTKRSALLFLGLALFLLTPPATAEVYTVTLHNGNVFTTRYKPEDASFDSSQVMFLTNMANWIAIPKADIANIESEIESKGFGLVLNTTTIMIGQAPNDNLTPEEAAEAAAQAGAGGGAAQQPAQDFTVEQFVEPNSSGGLPLDAIGRY